MISDMPTKNPVLLRLKHKRWKARRKAKAKLIRNQWFQDNGPCKCCDSWDRLELDHIIPFHSKKRVKNEKIWMWSESKRNQELSKCQPLCWTCHRNKSAFENRSFVHGRSMYDRHGCKCRICRDASAQHKRNYRAKKRMEKFENSRVTKQVSTITGTPSELGATLHPAPTV